MNIFQLQEKRIDALLAEVRTIKAYSRRIEDSLVELRQGYGTEERVKSRNDIKKEEIRQKVKQRFSKDSKN